MKKIKRKEKKAKPLEWRVEVPAAFYVTVEARTAKQAINKVAKAMYELDLDEPSSEFWGSELDELGFMDMRFGCDSVEASNPKKLKAWRSV